ncbi:aminoglycoside phosphotransferase family protein [uncultured Sphingobacterium sp.]|jgi:streptomycin 6-kinase|uniref:aminoglycoside phosphotransferase family protein n=1 Tax=uncultured Sphingobacterium sp. TaxID=182688 RepID=UPI003747D843
MTEPILALYINKWNLTQDGASFRTNSSLLQPCVYKGLRADWFAPLLNKTNFSDETLKESALVAIRLLSDQTERYVLHGDLHHENILYSDLNGRLAIDPKALYGDRAFDFAKILCNPNRQVALDKDRLVRQIEVIGQETKIDFDRMLNWVIAWVGLSAIWMEEDHLDASLPIQLAKIALSLKK